MKAFADMVLVEKQLFSLMVVFRISHCPTVWQLDCEVSCSTADVFLIRRSGYGQGVWYWEDIHYDNFIYHE